MVYLVTGPRGSGKTQQMIDLANEKVKTSNGHVVFIKKSHKDTYTVWQPETMISKQSLLTVF